mmetsp:Transcript_12059/g.23257  ORF Transcript_12059/g.23257 Transcript_12059/m.23257 type:complete len:97 (+) Transcript_12059:228-518(+)
MDPYMSRNPRRNTIELPLMRSGKQPAKQTVTALLPNKPSDYNARRSRRRFARAYRYTGTNAYRRRYIEGPHTCIDQNPTIIPHRETGSQIMHACMD